MKRYFVILFVLCVFITLELFYQITDSNIYEIYVENLDPTEEGRIIERSFSKSVLSKYLNNSQNGERKPTTSELNFILLLRKLVLWSVKEINLRIEGYECTHWWANPLSIVGLQQIQLSRTLSQYVLTFELQPGRIPFESVVNVQKIGKRRARLPHEPDDLALLSARRLDALPEACGAVPGSIRNVCLCSEETREAEMKSLAAREEWKVSDPELLTWPPDSSFMVSDFLPFGTMNAYLKSPVNNTRFCDPKLKMIIFVSSSPNNLEGRMAIRQSYGNAKFLEKNHVQILFAFDKVPEVDLQAKIDSEFEKFDDIIQAGHAHSYHNLTYRDLSMFNWLVTQCRLQNSLMPPWAMKTDDDYFINVPFSLEVADANPEVEMMGGSNCGQPVIRDVSYMRKYYVPRYIYAANMYPGYLSGATWIIRTDIFPLLLKASLTTPTLFVDDVYISGMLPREVGIRPRGLKVMSYKRRAGPCMTKQMINSAVDDAADFGVHWNYFNDPLPANCTFDSKNLKVLPISRGSLRRCYFNA